MQNDTSDEGTNTDIPVTSGNSIFDGENAASSPDYCDQQLDFLTYIINTVADPIFVKNEKHQWLVLSDAFCQFMGRAREELIGKSDFDFFPKEEAEIFWKMDDEVFSSGKENTNEEHFTTAGGEEHIISTKKSVFVHPDTGHKYLVGVIRDVTDTKDTERRLKLLMTELKELSITDGLTGLANRRHLYTLAEREILLAKRNKQGILLIFADIDNLKHINDEYGHLEGDYCIVEVANILKDTLRESDVIARIGGDEFVVLITGKSLKNGDSAVERLKFAINERNAQLSTPYSLSLSIGFSYSTCSEDITVEDLINRADISMYMQKKKFTG